MRQGRPLRRTPIRRGKGLRPKSKKREEREWEREQIRLAVHRRDRTCRGLAVLTHDCVQQLDVHELIPRSAWADGIYRADNCLLLCRAAHRWVTAHSDAAAALGLHVKRSTVDRIGREQALLLAADRRASAAG